MPLPLKESVCSGQKLPRDDEILRGRAQFLGRSDRNLFETVVLAGQSTRSVAMLMGVEPRAVRRRVYRLSKRMASPRYVGVARSLAYLGETDGELVRLHVCEGLSHRKLLARLGVSVHTIRRRLDQIEAKVALLSSCRPHSLLEGVPPL